ncbi:MAG: FtsX-like permease family protein [Prevotellaceae bacterium]|nr:FtsX-like permease family protein [Prevotellaceae bacterium]
MTYLTYLSRNKLFAIVNVAGLSISLMFVLLIANMTVRQLTVDDNQPDKERTYIFSNEKYAAGHYRYGLELESCLPFVEDWCAVSNRFHVTTGYNDKQFEMKAHLVKKNFFEFFSGFKMLDGTAKDALAGDDNVVLTRSGAIKLFGTDHNVVGKVIRREHDEERNMVVTAVVEDIDNSIFRDDTEMFLPFEQMNDFNPSCAIDNVSMDNAASALLFFRFTEGANPNADEEGLVKMMKEFAWNYTNDLQKRAFFMPMKDFYFSTGEFFLDFAHYNFTIILVFMIVGIIILLMSVFNYVGMSVAQTSYRAKEMATRRLLGSSKQSIFWRMIGESAMMVTCSFLIAFLLALAVEPYAIDLLQLKMDIADDVSPLYVAMCLLFILLLSFVSGFVPASMLSSYNPLDVVKGTFRRKTKMFWLRLLGTFQSGLCIGLLACVGYLGVNIYRVLHTPLGYEYGNVLLYRSYGEHQGMLSFREEALKLPFVKHVSFSRGTPYDGGNNNTLFYQDGDSAVGIPFRVFIVDSAFLDIYHIQVQEDLHNGAPLFSEKALEMTKKISDGNSARGNGWNIPIGGSFKNFTANSVLDYGGVPQPLLMGIVAKEDIYPWTISVEVGNGDLKEFRQTLDRLYVEMTHATVADSNWYDDLMMDEYATYTTMEKVIVIFTLVALLISLLGLMAMNIYFITQRKRDIAVRKVFGSSTFAEQMTLVKFSFVSLLFSLLIAVPLMLFGFKQIDEVLSIEGAFPFWVPFAAFAVVAFVTAVSVILISYKAANENPVENLKTE